jgi:hypothetical protein
MIETLFADCQRQLQLAWRDLAELRAENERLKLETMAAKKREEHTRKELGHCHLALLALEGKMESQGSENANLADHRTARVMEGKREHE